MRYLLGAVGIVAVSVGGSTGNPVLSLIGGILIGIAIDYGRR